MLEGADVYRILPACVQMFQPLVVPESTAVEYGNQVDRSLWELDRAIYWVGPWPTATTEAHLDVDNSFTILLQRQIIQKDFCFYR